ncbi:MAG: hypothetical protein KKF56_05025 [Nanoarchaeota archaeon]|nr:hypothetical protein [Nanoarchaeota archaeon]
MKTIWKVLLPLFGGLILIGMALFIVIVFDQSWRWLWGVLILLFVAGVVVGIIKLILLKFNKRPPEQIKLDISSAKARAIYEQKMDTDNPDNFKIKNSILLRVGEKGKEKTPILHLEGKGTELNQDRDIIINLNNPKKEMTILIDASKDEVEKAIRVIAEHPPEEEQTETTIGMDMMGRPTTTTKIRRPSTSLERKMEEEKAKAEEVGGI